MRLALLILLAAQAVAAPAITVRSGTPSVRLTVTADGTEPFSYQWRKDGVAIPGATAATLALSNLTLANAGLYDVTVSNEVGSTLAPPARLSVADGSARVRGVSAGSLAFPMILLATP